MKKFFRACVLTLSLSAFLIAEDAKAQNVKAPVYSNEFLAIGAGARAQAMGNTFIATVNDVYGIYWNPAGLAGIESDIQLGLKHSEYFAGIANYDFGGVGIKLKDSAALGIGVIRFGVDDIPNTIFLVQPDGSVDYSKVTSFGVADYAVFISYGRTIKNLKVGGSVKVIHRNVGPFAEAWGFGLDAGMQYDLGKFTLAAMARDISSTWNAWSFSFTDAEKDVFLATGNEIPENSVEVTLPRLILGGAYKTDIGENFSLNSEVNVDLTFDGKRNTLVKTDFMSLDPHLGLEFGFKNMVFLRAGLGNIQRETSFDPGESQEFTSFQPNAGVGLKIKALSVDYAFSDLSNQSIVPYSHIISLRFDIGKDVINKNLGLGKKEE